MIEVKKEGIVLQKSSLAFEMEGVLNPAVIKIGADIHMFYRAVGKGNYSTVGYCKLSGPMMVTEQSESPVLFPQFDYESRGVEDPRIVKIDDLYYLSYTAYDGVNAMGALAVSHDLIHWEKKGIIVPQFTYSEFSRFAGAKKAINEKYLRYNAHERVKEKHGIKMLVWDKNVIFFPRRIQGKLFFMHRIKPDIQIVSFNDLDELNTEFWQAYLLHIEKCILLTPKYKHEISYLGGGCPPIETEHGWLIIYHSVHDTIKGYVYSACAALLDLEDPLKEIARLPYALFAPELDWELRGEVNNVCFPTGAVVIEDTLFIYYGAADERIACASVSMSALLQELILNQNQDAK